ncbi:peptidyl-prolyl cis-trans isomerase FKBP16-1, chloroplastic-like [Chenopodium quinoa]|uniref:peptidyl-prolyl cis-trans isomerase FKBP16-1, chloroplastic-like n=1 Tax=Chenopodium quinoa TaxID=63459 RepID=UPI000B77F7DD|nr:peptidyl-prolyl cis-trans isomerase FKBP16-1, chloroplastic-like [Chenopodium quinoa]
MAFTPVSLPQLSISLPRPSLLPRGTARKLNVTANYSVSDFASLTARNLSRRMLLSMGAVPILYNVNLALGAPIPQMEEPEILRTRKLPSGVRVQDIVDGEGPAAEEGDVVAFNYVCRRSNGYFVYSTVDQFTGEAMPVTLTLDEKQIIKGLKDVLIGMKVGGKRRALIPPSTGYVNESLKPIPEEFGPRRSLLSHANEPLIFEVQLLKIL